MKSAMGRSNSEQKRRSRLVRMPSSWPWASTTGRPEILYLAMTSRASRTDCSGWTVTGSTIMPDSERLTLSTSSACRSMLMFLWITPTPPNCAMAMAMLASVTVSIAADTIGRLSRIPSRVSRRADVELVRVDLRTPRHQEDIVKGQTDRNLSAHRLPFRCARSRRGISCTSCPNHTGTGRCVRPWAGRGVWWSASHRAPTPGCWPRAPAVRARWPDPSRRGAKGGADAPPLVLHVLHRLGVEEELDDVVFDALPHVLEEREGLALVLNQGVSLAVGPEADALPQVVEGQQVVLPLAVDGIEQEELLEPGKLVARRTLDPRLVVIDGRLSDQFLEIGPVDGVPVDPDLFGGETEVGAVLAGSARMRSQSSGSASSGQNSSISEPTTSSITRRM